MIKEIIIEIDGKEYKAILHPVYAVFADVPGIFVPKGTCKVTKSQTELPNGSITEVTYRTHNIKQEEYFKIMAIGHINPPTELFKKTHKNYVQEQKLPPKVLKNLGKFLKF